MIGRTSRCECLAFAEPDELIELAERALAQLVSEEHLVVVQPPETGMVVMQVREPVCLERFLLGEVVVTRAEVAIGDARGWSMRLGSDRSAALAAAVCDAAAETPTFVAEVEALCRRVTARRQADEAEQWARLAPTIVDFEELD